MNPPNSNLAGTKSLLLGMMAEARELKQAAGGSVTDAVAGWLAPQYFLAAREKLDGAEGARRWEILRLFAQDWATLRRGDHSAARLQLDRERLAFERKCAERPGPPVARRRLPFPSAPFQASGPACSSARINSLPRRPAAGLGARRDDLSRVELIRRRREGRIRTQIRGDFLCPGLLDTYPSSQQRRIARPKFLSNLLPRQSRLRERPLGQAAHQ